MISKYHKVAKELISTSWAHSSWGLAKFYSERKPRSSQSLRVHTNALLLLQYALLFYTLYVEWKFRLQVNVYWKAVCQVKLYSWPSTSCQNTSFEVPPASFFNDQNVLKLLAAGAPPRWESSRHSPRSPSKPPPQTTPPLAPAVPRRPPIKIPGYAHAKCSARAMI